MPDTLTHEPQAEPRTRPKTAHVTHSTAEWLVLAYLAADNGTVISQNLAPRDSQNRSATLRSGERSLLTT